MMQIPEWLRVQLNEKCPYCGAPIVNNDVLTDRYCSNPQCPEHMAYKMDALAKRLGIKNFGPATARAIIERNHFTMHTQILPIWFSNEKPSFYLHEIGEICFIKGYQKKWRDICRGHSSMAEVCMSPFTHPAIKRNMVLLCCTEAMCTVKPRLQGTPVNVMLTGSFQGYSARGDFIAEMNALYGEYIQLIDVGKRKTGVRFLIKEEWTTDHEKSAIARECGIEIITPGHLRERLRAAHAYIIRGGETE